MKFEIIETERLFLRKLSPAVLNDLFKNYSEEIIRKELALFTDAAYIKEKYRYVKGYEMYNKSMLYFQMMDKNTKQIIGSCGYYTWFTDHMRAEIGYSLYEDEHKGKGLMTEVMQPILEYGFNVMNLHRVEALISPDNTPSLKLVKKFHFKEEGFLRQHYFANDEFTGSLLFGLLKMEAKEHGIIK
ncbi:MAG: GNAT family protein [Bacteroidota bacterium]